jgi:hypothetical protein
LFIWTSIFAAKLNDTGNISCNVFWSDGIILRINFTKVNATINRKKNVLEDSITDSKIRNILHY